eukprot:3667807-Rhodomonas_salina.1
MGLPARFPLQGGLRFLLSRLSVTRRNVRVPSTPARPSEQRVEGGTEGEGPAPAQRQPRRSLACVIRAQESCRHSSAQRRASAQCTAAAEGCTCPLRASPSESFSETAASRIDGPAESHRPRQPHSTER